MARIGPCDNVCTTELARDRRERALARRWHHERGQSHHEAQYFFAEGLCSQAARQACQPGVQVCATLGSICTPTHCACTPSRCSNCRVVSLIRAALCVQCSEVVTAAETLVSMKLAPQEDDSCEDPALNTCAMKRALLLQAKLLRSRGLDYSPLRLQPPPRPVPRCTHKYIGVAADNSVTVLVNSSGRSRCSTSLGKCVRKFLADTTGMDASTHLACAHAAGRIDKEVCIDVSAPDHAADGRPGCQVHVGARCASRALQIAFGTFASGLAAAVHHDVIKLLMAIEGYVVNPGEPRQKLHLNFSLEALPTLAAEVRLWAELLCFVSNAVARVFLPHYLRAGMSRQQPSGNVCSSGLTTPCHMPCSPSNRMNALQSDRTRIRAGRAIRTNCPHHWRCFKPGIVCI